MIFVFVFLFLFSSSSFADSLSAANASLPAVIECYPELVSADLKLNMNLDLLKEKIDSRFVTSSTFLRMRTVTMKGADKSSESSNEKDSEVGVKKLKLSSEKNKSGKVQYVLSFKKIDEKGNSTDLPIDSRHKLNPLNQDFNSYLVDQEVILDESSYLDTKLNGATLSYKKVGLTVTELELSEVAGNKTLSCELRSQLGLICKCSKKSK